MAMLFLVPQYVTALSNTMGEKHVPKTCSQNSTSTICFIIHAVPSLDFCANLKHTKFQDFQQVMFKALLMAQQCLLRYFSSPKHSHWLGGPQSQLFNGYSSVLSRGYSSRSMNLKTYLQLLSRLRISTTVLSHLLYIFMVCTGTNSPSY